MLAMDMDGQRLDVVNATCPLALVSVSLTCSMEQLSPITAVSPMTTPVPWSSRIPLPACALVRMQVG